MNDKRLKEIRERDKQWRGLHLMNAEKDRRYLLAEVDLLRRRAEVAEEALRIMAEDAIPCIDGQCVGMCSGYRDLLGRCTGLCADGVSGAYALAEEEGEANAKDSS